MTHRVISYPGSGQAFFNDAGQRYHYEAATAAWREALGWFEQRLKS